jgi:hypothetical protein
VTRIAIAAWLTILCAFASIGFGGIGPGPLGGRVGARGAVVTGLGETVHAWAVLGNVGDEGDAAVLVHFAPRSISGAEGVRAGADAGSARRARQLTRPPEALAATGDRVVMVFAPESEGAPRRVLGLRAQPTPLDTVWAFVPGDRLDPYALLDVPGELLGVGFIGEGAGARLVVAFRDQGRTALAVLEGSVWDTRDLDARPGADARFIADGGRGLLTWTERDELRGLWVEADAMDLAERSMPALGLPPGSRVPDVLAAGELVWVDAVDDEFIVSAWLPGSPGARTVGRFNSPGAEPIAVVAGEGGGRLIALGRRDAEGGTAFDAVEMSLVSGRVAYEGPVQRALPVSAMEFRLLAVLLLGLTVATLLVAVRPASDPSVCDLPDGYALASPLVRAAASLLDLAMVTWVVSWIVGRPPGELLGLATLLDPRGGWVAAAMVLGTGVLLGTTCEAVFGRTPGKALLGCRVVRCGGGAGRAGVRPPTVLRLLARNVVKWWLTPLTVLSLIDGSAGRHRGDGLAGSVVVTRIPGSGDGRASGDPGD